MAGFHRQLGDSHIIIGQTSQTVEGDRWGPSRECSRARSTVHRNCSINSMQGHEHTSNVFRNTDLAKWYSKSEISGGKKLGQAVFLGRRLKQERVNQRCEKGHLKIVIRYFASAVSSAACWVVLHLMSPAWVRTTNQTCKHTMQISSLLLQ